MTAADVAPIAPREMLSLRINVHSAKSICRSRGTSWGPRCIRDWEHILVLSGDLRYASGSVERDLVQGDVLTIAPQESHYLEVRRGGEISCLHLDYLMEEPGGGIATTPLTRRLFPVVLHDTERGACGDLFLRLVDAYEGVGDYREGMLAALGYQLAVELTQLGCDVPQISARTQRMMRYLRQHATERVTRRELAQLIGVSESHVNAVFQNELGLTPTQYLHRIRLQLAHHLLSHEGLRVGEVAAHLGYYDAFHFSRAFKRKFGYAPSTLLQGRSRG